mgnify:CR=1 FL=1
MKPQQQNRIFPWSFGSRENEECVSGIRLGSLYETPAQVGVYSPGVLLPPLPFLGTL